MRARGPTPSQRQPKEPPDAETHAATVRRRWLRWGIAVPFFGYAASISAHLSASGRIAPNTAGEIAAFLLLGVALLILRAGRGRVAAAICISAVWLEVNAAVFIAANAHSFGTVALPCLIMSAGLLLGGRAALGLAALSSISVFSAALLGQRFRGIPLDRAETIYTIVILSVVYMATALLVRIALESFARVFERALSNERRFADLFDRAPDGIVTLTPSLAVEAVNPAAERILGRPAAKLVGRPLAELQAATAGEGMLAAVVSDDMPGLPTINLEFARSDGHRVVVEATSRRVPRSDGEGYQLMLRDVTERRAAEQRQRRLQEQLNHAQKLEAVGLLAGGVAHDFNNILTVVGGYADLLPTTPVAELPAVAAELRKVHDRGSGLTRQLLAFARREVVKPERIDLGAIVADARILLNRLCGEQVRLALELDDQAFVTADRGQIEQVLINLVANARDASHDGGIVTVTVRRNGSTVDLVVSDHGIGMSADTRERIFEPFFTTKPRGKGTGLGLSTVHGIAEQNGAQLHCESELGRGTTVLVRWPAAPPATSPSPDSFAEDHSRGEGRILLAEDDHATRTVVVRMLERHGFQVTAAASATAAIAAYHSDIDLLLTDIVMPGLSGLELAERLRVSRPDLPVLFMSGHIGEDLFGDQRIDPRTNLLSKPFRCEELVDRVRATLALALR